MHSEHLSQSIDDFSLPHAQRLLVNPDTYLGPTCKTAELHFEQAICAERLRYYHDALLTVITVHPSTQTYNPVDLKGVHLLLKQEPHGNPSALIADPHVLLHGMLAMKVDSTNPDDPHFFLARELFAPGHQPSGLPAVLPQVGIHPMPSVSYRGLLFGHQQHWRSWYAFLGVRKTLQVQTKVPPGARLLQHSKPGEPTTFSS